jgi:hypothetical protein
MANKYFNKQVAESRKPYKHGSYVYAEPNPNVDILKYKTKDGKDDGERYRVEDSEMKVSKKKREPSRSLMGRPSLPMPSKQKPESLERKKRMPSKQKPESMVIVSSDLEKKRQPYYMKKHRENSSRNKKKIEG